MQWPAVITAIAIEGRNVFQEIRYKAKTSQQTQCHGWNGFQIRSKMVNSTTKQNEVDSVLYLCRNVEEIEQWPASISSDYNFYVALDYCSAFAHWVCHFHVNVLECASGGKTNAI